MGLFSHKPQVTSVGAKKGTGPPSKLQVLLGVSDGMRVMGHGVWAGKEKAGDKGSSRFHDNGGQEAKARTRIMEAHLIARGQFPCLCLKFHHHLCIPDFLILQGSP